MIEHQDTCVAGGKTRFHPFGLFTGLTQHVGAYEYSVSTPPEGKSLKWGICDKPSGCRWVKFCSRCVKYDPEAFVSGGFAHNVFFLNDYPIKTMTEDDISTSITQRRLGSIVEITFSRPE